MKTDLREVTERKRRQTGIAIPLYLRDGMDREAGSAAIRNTVRAFAAEVVRPQSICLSVDGPGPAVALARDLSRELGVRVAEGARNRGKLSAVRQGMGVLLRDPGLRYLAAVDQDGDHFPNELLNFVRAAHHAEAVVDARRVMVLGRRISRHRPMGFCRGELEELADRVLLDALQYRSAIRQLPLRLAFALTLDEAPDFHSGYKLFTRSAAEAVFGARPRLCGVPPDAYYRHAVEAVLTVEAIECGALLVVINRSTFDEQPMSTFGLLDRQRLVADKMIWPCRRLAIPPAFVRQWLENHLPRLQLLTLLPQGKLELLGIARLVMEGMGAREGDSGFDDDIARMPFI